MKRIFTPLLITLVLFCSASATAAIISLPANGTIADSVTGDSAWLYEDTFGDGIDFITFDVTAQSTFSATVDSIINMGVSLYQGTLANNFAIPFSNSADFTDLFSNLVYVDGSNPFLPGFGGTISSQVLEAGSYTLAIGGNEGFFDTFTEYNYNLEVAITEIAQVSEPMAFALLCFGITGLVAARKKTS